MKGTATAASLLVFVLGASGAFAQESGPQGASRGIFQGYTCCNLHYDRDWISDANWGNLPKIAPGTPIKVTSYGFNRAAVEIDGKPMRLGHDYGRNEESLEKWVSKIVVKTSPKAKIERAPEKIRAAIRDGRVVPGMTRDQAIMSIGYPPTHRTRSTDEPVWHVWGSRAGRYEIHWTPKGTVEKIVGQQP
jgi:hypothetical protein